MDSKSYIREVGGHIIRRYPVIWLLGMIIVAVHHQTVGAEKPFLFSASLRILRCNIIMTDGLPKRFLIGNLNLLCVYIVSCLSRERRGI